MQFVGINSLDFWGCILFSNNDSSSMLYQTHPNTFYQRRKGFRISPGNAHCENSAKVLMWWPPWKRGAETWFHLGQPANHKEVLKPLVDLLCFRDEFSPISRTKDQPRRSCTSGVCLSTRVLMSKGKCGDRN